MDNTKDTEIKVDEEQVRKDAERVAREKAIENVNKKIVIVDTQEMAEAEARKAADAYMTEDKAKSGFLKKFWKHTFLEGFYRQRQVDRVREEILNSGNMYTGRAGDDKTAHNNTMQAISERFISDYDGLVREREGEKKEVLNDTNPKTVQAKNDIKNIITEYAKNHIQEEAFNEEKNRIFNTLNDKKARESLNSYADNLLEIAQNARIALDHGAQMEDMDLDTNIILGKAKSSLKTEAHYNFLDKAVAWTKSSKIGRFFSPALISTTIGLGYSLSVGLGTRVLRSKVAAYGTFGAAVAVSTALAGANESQRLAAERAQHGLERAEGGIIGPDSERREEMEQFQYQMESSKNLSERLRGLMFEKDKDGNDVPKDVKQEDLDQIFASLAEIDARHSLNQKRKVDLISYTNIGSVEKESMELDILTARTKIELKNRIQSGKLSLHSGETFDSYLTRQSEAVERCLCDGEKGVDANDKSFSKFKTKEVIKKMLITVAVGLTVGAVAQEAWASYQDNNQGFIEGMFHHDVGATTQTPLEHIHSWITGHPTHVPMGDAVETNIFGHDVRFPEGTTWIDNGDGSINIMKGDQVVSDHFTPTWNSGGSLDEAALARLGHDGIVANTVCNTIEGSQEVTTSAKDWVNNNPNGTTHISRSWMENNTPMYPDPNHAGHLLGADLNELRTQWVGNGIDEHGDYVMTVQHMTDNGSFENGISVAAQEEMQKGNLEVLLSVTKDTQAHVIKGIIGTDGLIHFNHEDANVKMLFENVNGHAQYDGAFIEIAKHSGNLPDGREMMQILSTHIGTDHAHDIIQNIPVPIEIPVTDMIPSIDTEPAMFIPFFTRTPLEPITYKEEEIPRYTYNKENRKRHYSELKSYRNSPEQAEALINNISTNENLKGKYGFIQKRLIVLKKYKTLPPEAKAGIEKQAFVYNQRNPDRPVTVDQFVDKEIKRLYSQAENIYIENAKVGEKPFEKSFYENSPLLKGLENCKEVVVVLDDPMGDGILSLPIINTINKYFEVNGINKNVKVISKNFSKLYKSLEDQFSNVQVLSIPESEKYFEKNNKDLFVFNTNGNFDNYNMFGMNEEDSKNLAKVFSVDWASWTKEESPIDEHKMTKYDPLPSRIARSLEIMLGQKLFEDIKNTEKYLEKSKNFDKESKEIKKKYGIKDTEQLIVISVGSSASPKEYSPEKWSEVVDGIFAKNPNAHILVLNDPNPAKRDKYGKMFKNLSSKKGYKISHADEGLDKMNTMMSMADVVVTPDTGLGHYAAALGKKTVMLYLTDPVLWSAPGARRVVHPKGYETYKKGIGLDSKLWGNGRYGNNEYYIEDDGVGIGASEIGADKVLDRIFETNK